VSLLDLVSEFVALSGESEWGGDSLPRVKELMVELRRRGFTSLEVSELSGGRWADSVVRGYTRGWGGVVDVSEKMRIMSALRRLVSSNYTIESVEWFTKVNESIGLKQSTLEEVAELNKNMGDLGLVPGEVGEMLAVSRSVREEPGGVKGVRDRVVLDKELRDKGVTHEVMLSLKEKCERYGGVSGLLEGMDHYVTIQDLKSESTGIAATLIAKKKELVEVETWLERHRGTVDALTEIYDLKWTSMSLMAFPQWLRASDTPESIREALKGTRSIQDLQARIKDLSKRNTALALENAHYLRQSLRAYDNLAQLSQDIDLGQEFDKRREEVKRRLNLKFSGEDTLVFAELLYDYVAVDAKRIDVHKVLLKAVSNYISAVEADQEITGLQKAAKLLGPAKAELEYVVAFMERERKVAEFIEKRSKQ
jgi:hypothetical protein